MLDDELGTFSLTLFLISSMMGSNIFIIPPRILHASNSYTFALSTWLLGLLITGAIGVCYAELGACYPCAAGDTTYLKEGYSALIGNIFSLVSVFVVLPAMCSIMLNLVSKNLGYNKHVTNGVIIMALLVLNVLSVSLSIKLQNVFTVVRIALMSIFIFTALLVVLGIVKTNSPSDKLQFDFKLDEFLISILFILGTFDGFNSGNFISERVRDPKKSFIRAIITSLIVVGVIYMLICYSMFVVIPSNSFFTSNDIMKAYFDHLDVQFLKTYFPKILVIFPCVGSLNGCFILIKSIVKSHVSFPNSMLALISLLVFVFTLLDMISVLRKIGLFTNIFYMLSITTLFKLRKKKQLVLNIPLFFIVLASFMCLSMAYVSFYYGFFR